MKFIKGSWFVAGSCCGGKTQASMWDPDAQIFKCIDCNSPTSTDPSYLGGVSVEEPSKNPWFTPKTKPCECGGTKTNTTHAFYCPLWTGYK